MSFTIVCVVSTIGLALFVQYQLQTFGIFPVANVLPDLPDFPTSPTVLQNITGSVELIGENELVGPESMVRADEGYLFVALGDGRTARLRHSNDTEKKVTWEFLPLTGSVAPKPSVFSPADVTETEAQCGRPLGITIVKRSTVDAPYNNVTNKEKDDDDDEDVLMIADAYKGLIMMTNIYDKDVGRIQSTILAVRAGTDPPEYHFSLLNGLVQTPSDGSIYLTETTRHFQRRRIFWAVLEGRSTGRLLRYNPQTGVDVVADNLFMPNGITLSHDGKYLMIVSGVQVLRYSLEKHEIVTRPFVSVLPGTGDNIHAMSHLPSGEPRKCYWAGLGSKFAKPFSLLKMASEKPILKSLLVALVPYKNLINLIPKLSALAVYDETGDLIQVYRDDSNVFPWVSEGGSFDGYLYLGSWYNPSIARVKENSF